MSFREKSTWVLLAATVIVYGWYFATTLGEALGAETPPVVDNVRLFGAVVVMVVLSIVAHIVIAILSPKDADAADERDRLIELRGDQRGGFLMTVALFSTMGLAMTGASVFWIAHGALAGLVVSELVKAVSKLIDYRRGV
ncbi:hypothetical protein HXX25_08680 [Hyphobacterium sp. CCMP332]|uniref:hypothetical protein n=1 Tax=Hyphobacterium sp. CCMP332 TaxID=2749086 RepID=UPI001650B1DB|nr:hypothetical protein [Hyphobacterium sp. CCMP332]QNL19382.1 hypothetical protein HXX25_08680 [Hyphobacterium sp. CCMP332]